MERENDNPRLFKRKSVEMIILDTNILIDILKGKEKTIEKVQNFTGSLAISSITTMELYYGAFDKAEINKLEKFIALFQVIHISERISSQAVKLVKTYAKSHNLDIPDSLIASSAIVNNCQLFTHNRKDFRYIEQVELV